MTITNPGSSWRKGMRWLSGGGNATQRIAIARQRERIAARDFPGALKRPAIFVPYSNRKAHNAGVKRRRSRPLG